MGSPLLSVCIPTFNRGDWLVSRVQSWLSVPLHGFEIVVSDNASQDGTAEKLASIQDDRFLFLRNDENVGSFENQLRTFEAARGRYVMQLMDKDELDIRQMSQVLDLLADLEVACGEFMLNIDGGGEPLNIYGGVRALRRYGLLFTHPSGRFFSAAVIRKYALLSRLRRLEEEIRPYSTDYLVSLALCHGEYARIGIPFVIMNMPPYEGVSASTTYRETAQYYFTPEFLIREFVIYVRFLRQELRLPLWQRVILAFKLAGGVVLRQCTIWYLWRLDDDAICRWYGIGREFREKERKRDLLSDYLSSVWNLKQLGMFERIATRLGAIKGMHCCKQYSIPERIRRRQT